MDAGPVSSSPVDSRVVLVTGGARGIGAATTGEFRARGSQVVACGRRHPTSPLPGVDFVQCDVRRPDQVDGMIAGIVAKYGALDVVVNNAGGSSEVVAESLNPESFSKIVELNLLAPFYVAQAANRVMQEQPSGGSIVNVGSVAAIRPPPGFSAYAAAKAGLMALTRALAVEWAPRVRVNCVVVGLVRTDDAMRYYTSVEALAETIPAKRLAEPVDVARACVALASVDLAYVTGANLPVDGGGEVPSFFLRLSELRGGTGL